MEMNERTKVCDIVGPSPMRDMVAEKLQVSLKLVKKSNGIESFCSTCKACNMDQGDYAYAEC